VEKAEVCRAGCDGEGEGGGLDFQLGRQVLQFGQFRVLLQIQIHGLRDRTFLVSQLGRDAVELQAVLGDHDVG
jgi:hypothetical protein